MMRFLKYKALYSSPLTLYSCTTRTNTRCNFDLLGPELNFLEPVYVK